MSESRFAGQKLDAAGFEKEFGLKSVSEADAYSKGSSTGTKQVGALGTYLTEDDYNRLKNDDSVWDAYSSVYGEDKMNDKRESNEDGLSINALDALFDKLSADKPAEAAAPAKEEPVYYSDKTASAKAGEAAYEKVILPYQGDYIMGRKTTNPSDDFMREYQLQLRGYKGPRDPNQIDGPAYSPAAEEAAVAGVDNIGTTAVDVDFDRDRDLYFS